MRKALLFALVFLLIPSALALSAQDIYDSSSLTVKLNVSSSARIIADSSYTIDEASVNLTFLPLSDAQQTVQNMQYSPIPSLSDDAALFTWKNPPEEISFFLSSEIKNTNAIPHVTKKVKFPLENVGGYDEYVLPTEKIDSDNEQIIRLASDIAAGEDDEFIIVSKLAQWSHANIRYDLSTMTANVSQKASWVLDNRQGVCDE